jgi:hypothetical protein
MKTTILTTLAFCLFSATTAVAQSKNLEIKAFYEGYEGKTYFFEDQYGESYEFTTCAIEVLKEFELKTEKSINQAFLITYLQPIEYEEYAELEILKLKVIALKKVEIEEEDYEDED